MSDRDGWVVCDDADLGVRFEYPETTVHGKTVTFSQRPMGIGARVQVLSKDRRDVYFEVARFPSQTAAEGYKRFNVRIERWFAARGLAREPLVPMVLAGRAAQSFRFTWPGFERQACFTEQSEPGYRVIFDPRSRTNWEILAALRFR